MENPAQFIQLVQTLLFQQRFDEALHVCQSAISQNPDNPVALNFMGEIYCAQGRYDRALGFYLQACDMVPDSYACHNNAALCLQIMDRMEEALQHYNDSIRLHPTRYALNNRATIYNADNRSNEALADVSQALKMSDCQEYPCSNAQLLATRAAIYMAKGDYRSALRDVNAGMETTPYDNEQLIAFYDKALLTCNLKLGISPCAGKGCK